MSKWNIFEHKLFVDSLSIACGFAVMNLFPNFIQRILLQRDYKQTQKALYIKICIYAVFLVLVTLNGILAFVITPDTKSYLALYTLIDQIIPIGLKGIVIVGLLSAVMSTADSDLNISSITIVKDIINHSYNIKNEKVIFKIVQIINILIGCIAVVIAIYFTSVVDLLIFMAGFWSSTILVPLTLAMFDIVIKDYLMLISAFLGMLSFILWETFDIVLMFSVRGVFLGAAVNFVLFIIFYYMSYYYNKNRY
jgi:Na+/pantothenate symporter